jgi:DNA segregation ATPase FtsK/SpoIIIE-like protein
VVAIESEREFGLSVLQRLDGISKERGELFRRAEVADLASYRSTATGPLPRVLLLIDEFQEFFTDDDVLAKEARLLLDRLVRQGRAFGVHLVLGGGLSRQNYWLRHYRRCNRPLVFKTKGDLCVPLGRTRHF